MKCIYLNWEKEKLRGKVRNLGEWFTFLSIMLWLFLCLITIKIKQYPQKWKKKKDKNQLSALLIIWAASQGTAISSLDSWRPSKKEVHPKIPQNHSVIVWIQMYWEGAFKASKSLKWVMSSLVKQWWKGRRNEWKASTQGGPRELVILEAMTEQQTWAALSLPPPHSPVTVEPTHTRNRCRLSAKEAPSGWMLEEHGWWRKCAPGASAGSSPIQHLHGQAPALCALPLLL